MKSIHLKIYKPRDFSPQHMYSKLSRSEARQFSHGLFQQTSSNKNKNKKKYFF